MSHNATNNTLPVIPGPAPEEPYRSMIQQFLALLYQDGYSVTTIASYGWHLNKLAIWLVKKEIRHPDQVSPAIAIEWGGYLRSKYAEQTHKQSAVATKLFFKFLADIHYCNENAAKDIERFLSIPKVKTEIQRTLSLDDLDALYAACQTRSTRDVRNLAIMAVLVDTGLRAGELCRVKMENINFHIRRIQVVGKGGGEEFVYYSPKCQDYLKIWLDLRADFPVEDGSLFVSLGGNTPGASLTTRGLRIILKQLGEKAGVANVHPHAFRRSFATLRIKGGQSTRGVQKLGRWRNLSTFERYTAALMIDDEFAQKEASAYSPLKKITDLPMN